MTDVYPGTGYTRIHPAPRHPQFTRGPRKLGEKPRPEKQHKLEDAPEPMKLKVLPQEVIKHLTKVCKTFEDDADWYMKFGMNTGIMHEDSAVRVRL